MLTSTPRPRRRTARVAALLGALALVAASCGGDDDDTDADPVSTTADESGSDDTAA